MIGRRERRAIAISHHYLAKRVYHLGLVGYRLGNCRKAAPELTFMAGYNLAIEGMKMGRALLNIAHCPTRQWFAPCSVESPLTLQSGQKI